jgi:2-polyprenyl-6-methoxyphenol hydroxylase-like FAD-dependent oxidoreductase
MAHVERTLVVGGGIGGLTLAAALRRHGLAAELVERAPTWRTVGAGLAVQPNGLRVLYTLGVGDAVERAGAVIRRWDFCDAQGAPLCETDLEALWRGAPPSSVWSARGSSRRCSPARRASRCGSAPRSLRWRRGGGSA